VLILQCWTARQVLDDDIVASVSTEKQRTALAAQLDKMEDWLYEDGVHAPAPESRCGGSGPGSGQVIRPAWNSLRSAVTRQEYRGRRPYRAVRDSVGHTGAPSSRTNKLLGL